MKKYTVIYINDILIGIFYDAEINISKGLEIKEFDTENEALEFVESHSLKSWRK